MVSGYAITMEVVSGYVITSNGEQHRHTHAHTGEVVVTSVR